MADGGVRKTVADWLKLGIQLPPGTSMPPNVDQLSAALRCLLDANGNDLSSRVAFDTLNVDLTGHKADVRGLNEQ